MGVLVARGASTCMWLKKMLNMRTGCDSRSQFYTQALAFASSGFLGEAFLDSLCLVQQGFEQELSSIFGSNKTHQWLSGQSLSAK